MVNKVSLVGFHVLEVTYNSRDYLSSFS
jgi:hypothetical protein